MGSTWPGIGIEAVTLDPELDDPCLVIFKY